MPVKTKNRKTHHSTHKKEKRTRGFLKVYAPYIPLLLIVSCGIALSSQAELKRPGPSVKSYATNTSDTGLLEATNKQRLEQGLHPLKFDTTLDAAAQAKAQDMGSKDYWAHKTPEGDEPWIFFEAENYRYRKAAENLAYGFTTSDSTVAGWMNSPGHRANLLDPGLDEVGFGIINVPDYQNRGPQTVVVAMYGKPMIFSDPGSPQLPVATNTGSSKSRSISYIQSLTVGKAPWSTFAIGLVVGAIVMYLAATHVRGMRRALRTSENFVIHHPIFDITLVAFLALAAIASQNIGTIY